jgi:AcrR family transcriptional regulator
MHTQIAGAAAQSRAARQRMWTRERLTEAARRVIARKGIDDTTIADITSEADVGIGSFYNHFKSKEDLVGTLVGQAIEVHGAALDRLVADVSDPAEVFAICIRHTIRMADHDPVWAWFTVRAGLYVRNSVRARRALMRDLVRGIESGRFTPRDRPSALVVIGGAVVAAMQGTAARRARRAGRPPDRRAPAADARGSGRQAGASRACRSVKRWRRTRDAAPRAAPMTRRRCEPRARTPGRDGLRPQQVHGLPELRRRLQDALDA